MAVNLSYSLQQIDNFILPLGDEGSDAVGLLNGGWAVSADDVDAARVVATIYSPNGTIAGQISDIAGEDSAIAELNNGNLVVTATSANAISYQIFSPNGSTVVPGTSLGDTNSSSSDVAALVSGGFVVVSQDRVSATDSDIDVSIRSNSGAAVTSFTVDSGANNQQPSVAALADGGLVVVWERHLGGGSIEGWAAVYDANGTVRKAPFAFDDFGTINRNASVTALDNGGFQIALQDNEFDNGLDVSVSTFDASGTFLGVTQASALGTSDNRPALATLSNGLVLSVFTNDFDGSGGDLDLRATLLDENGAALTDVNNPLIVAFTTQDERQSSIAALSQAQALVSFTNNDTGEIQERLFQLVRTSVGDGANDVIIGDDSVDIMRGGDGADQLDGKGNKDRLNGGGNDDLLLGGNGNDLLQGGTGNDSLRGGGDNDKLSGQDGNDSLIGGEGRDTLNGGAGFDVFEFRSVGELGIGANSDRISDFEAGVDTIDLHRLDANVLVGGNQDFTFIGAADFSGTAGELRAFQSGGNTFVAGDVNGDGSVDFAIKLSGTVTLSAGDFDL